MAKIKVEGKLVDVPDDATPEEMDQIAADMAGDAPLSAVAETIAAPVMPLAAQMGLPGAKASMTNLLNPNAGKFGVTRPLESMGEKVEGAATSALGNIEDKLMASPLGQKFPRATAAVASLPLGLAEGVTGFGKPSFQQQSIGSEGMFQGLPLMGKAAVKKATPALAESILEKSLPQGAQEAAAEVVKAPEITKPGFYKKNIGLFAEKVVAGLERIKESAAKLSGKLTGPLGKTPVVKPSDIAAKMGQEVQKMPEAAVLDSVVGPKIDDINKTISDSARLGTGADKLLRLEDAVYLRHKITDTIDASIKSGATEQPFVNALMQTRKHLDELIESGPNQEAAITYKAARVAQAGKFSAMKELKKVAGIADDAADSDVATKIKSFLANDAKLNDPDILKNLERIEGGLGGFAKQLSAMRKDPFKQLNLLVPMLGIGGGGMGLAATGWMTQNPIKAAVASLVLAGISATKSPRLIGNVIRSAAAPVSKVTTTAAKVGAQSLPGFIKRKKNENR